MARVKCPHGWEVGLLRSLWIVYIQVCQPFQNSYVIYSVLEPINIHNLYTFRYVVHTFGNISVFGVKSQRSYQVLVP